VSVSNPTEPDKTATNKNSATEIKSGAEGALEEDIATLSEATGSVADVLNQQGTDPGKGVDWSTKTPKTDVGGSGSVSGSGYIISAFATVQDVYGSSEYLDLDIDGSNVGKVLYIYMDTDAVGTAMSSALFWRFESSFAWDVSSSGSYTVGGVNYALD